MKILNIKTISTLKVEISKSPLLCRGQKGEYSSFWVRSFIVIAMTCVLSNTTVAQENEEENELNGGTITVVKPYDPTISDAFKVKSVPAINDTTQVKKKPVTYSIFSVPVASTFTPAKGKLSTRKKTERAKFFDNYARLGLGNYVNVLAEFAGNIEIDKDTDFGVFLNHFSSQGGIDEAVFNDAFSDTSLDLSYGKRNRGMSWGITAGGRFQTANWYGAPQGTGLIPDDDIDVGTNYLTLGLGGKARFFDSAIEQIDLQLFNTGSNYDASETQITLRPEFGFDIMEEEIGLGATVDYLTGAFDNQDFLSSDYSFLNLGVNPSINLYGDRFKAELGAGINYLSDLENSEGQIYVYPDINASYILVDEKVMAFTTIGGGLDMNSLRGFADENIFIAPAVLVAPTNRQLDAQLGIKGKLSENFGYKVFGGYRLEEDRGLFVKNPFSFADPSSAQPYQFGNTFSVAYGDLNTFTFGGALSVDVNSQFNLTLNAASLSYDVSNGDDFNNVASQLPSFTADLIGNYDITDQWNVGATLYYVGERDVFTNVIATTTTLDAFLDLNLDVNYKINPKLTAFLRGHNLTGGNYQYYLDVPVQNLQILGGAVYKFDF